MSKLYNIPVVWQSTGVMEIEADSLEEALKEALNDFPLPYGDYIDDTIEIDYMSPTMYDVVEDKEVTFLELLQLVEKIYKEYHVEDPQLLIEIVRNQLSKVVDQKGKEDENVKKQ